MLADTGATAELQELTRLIVESPALLGYEDQVYARFTRELADELAAEIDAGPGDIEPSVVAHALIGLHRSLVAYARAGTMAGLSNASVARGVRDQAKQAIALLETGLGTYGVRRHGSKRGRCRGSVTIASPTCQGVPRWP